MEDNKREIADLHQKNIQSAINEKTAALSASLENIRRENERLLVENKNKKINITAIILTLIIGVIIGLLFNAFIR